MDVILITGASSGIGREFAMQLDQILTNQKEEFWLIARRGDRLEELADQLAHSCRILPLDLTDDADRGFLTGILGQEKPVVRMLINCAGFGLMGRFDTLSGKEQDAMLQLNCKALTQMTYLCLPYMKKNSRIIQLASSAAFLPQPNFAVYAATKAYVLSLSRALGEELRKKQIYVTAVCPGPVRTEFFDIAERYGTTLKIKKLTYVDPDRVVRDALRASYQKKPVSVCSPLIKMFHCCSKVLPHSLLLTIMRCLK